MTRDKVILKWSNIIYQQREAMSVDQVNEFCKDCTEANVSMSDIMLAIINLR